MVAQSKYVTSDLMGVSPSDLSTVQQSAVCVVPTALSVHVTPELVEAKTAPAKPFKCPNCHFCMSDPVGSSNLAHYCCQPLPASII